MTTINSHSSRPLGHRSPREEARLSDAAERVSELVSVARGQLGSTDPVSAALGLTGEAAPLDLDLVEAMKGGPTRRGGAPGQPSLASLISMGSERSGLDGLSLELPDSVEAYDAAKAAGRSSLIEDMPSGGTEPQRGRGGPTPAGLSEGSWWDQLVSAVKAMAGGILPGPSGAAAGVGLDSSADTYRGVEGLKRQGDTGTTNEAAADQLEELERNGYRHEFEPAVEDDLLDAHLAHLKGTPFDPDAGRRRVEEHDETQPAEEVSNPNPLADADSQGERTRLSLAGQLVGPQAPDQLSQAQLESMARARIGDFDRRSDPRVIDPPPES